MYRLCYFCYQTFEIAKERTDYTFLCPGCKEKPEAQHKVFNHIAMNRNHNVDMFDSWADPDRKEKVCRVCGAELLDKRKCYCLSCHYPDLYQEVGGHPLQFSQSCAIVWGNSKRKYNRFKCEECDKKGEDVHHIVPVHKSSPNFHLIFEMDNLILLCKECHKKKHSKEANEIKNNAKWKKLDDFLKMGEINNESN